VDATADEVKMALENLPSINVLNVKSISSGWSVTYLSEAGNLPLMEVTSGRLLGILLLSFTMDLKFQQS
jgi:hypothetical protein